MCCSVRSLFRNVAFFVEQTRTWSRFPSPFRWLVIDATAISELGFFPLSELWRHYVSKPRQNGVVLATRVGSCETSDQISNALV